jgi:hypothetical protein
VPAPNYPEGMRIGLATAGQILIPFARRVPLVLGEFNSEDVQQSGTIILARMFNQA